MDLIEFIYESNKAKTEEELLSCFLKFLKEFGLNRFLMAELSHDSLSNKEKNFGVLFNYPSEWIKHYIDNHYIDIDPVYNYKKGLFSQRPFLWDEVYDKNLTTDAIKVMEEAKDFNLLNGVALAIHKPLGGIVGMAFASDKSTDRVKEDKNALSLINAASNQFFNAYNDIVNVSSYSDNKIDLTNREREVLLWLARGKTKSDISEILSISESTVKRYSESLLKKLDANNMPLAIVKALRMGLISPF